MSEGSLELGLRGGGGRLLHQMKIDSQLNLVLETLMLPSNDMEDSG